MWKPEKRVPYEIALQVMEKLLAGELPKNIASDLNILVQRVTDVKNMFPLFLKGDALQARRKAQD